MLAAAAAAAPVAATEGVVAVVEEEGGRGMDGIGGVDAADARGLLAVSFTVLV